MIEERLSNQRGQIAAPTSGREIWWLQPMLIVSALGGFMVYTAWAALQGTHYEYKNYFSPFYPTFAKPEWWPLSPALLIIWAPAGFRFTCYYFRKAFHRSFLLTPPACAVADARAGYTGESRFPLVLMNLHRYFLCLAAVELMILWYHAALSVVFDGRLGAGMGSLIMVANVALLSLYLTSCHSFRHLVGGRLDCFSHCPTRHAVWGQVSRLNERHDLWFWLSLFSVGSTDLYIRLLSMGIISDMRLF
ncbi:MAG: succinate dehydrogenase [Candidatus Methylomirabilis oxygeniifera]|uniref:Putative succinate dehydrogenase membrane anchor subunit (SdhD) n=1 Tax=Methylomirabilis oxygeniifera TaxID=671143 RepID=D5MH13_METO1|nr:MAG: succinate dehydrogenase [Candidatus Methylomirabilis oxyfera]CBE69044.1 putative succinate dehydrogenase membrane anchor subunit (sdhD) [Candidatus Methylomirabilis oxyfera]